MYLISKHLHTSYTDIYNITPTERRYLLTFITESINRENEQIKNAIEERKNN